MFDCNKNLIFLYETLKLNLKSFGILETINRFEIVEIQKIIIFIFISIFKSIEFKILSLIEREKIMYFLINNSNKYNYIEYRTNACK